MKKRIFSILLTLCMVLALCPLTAFADEPLYIKGDIDRDGKVTINDAELLQQYLVASIDFTPEELAVADFNEDGLVNANDLTALQNYLSESGTPEEPTPTPTPTLAITVSGFEVGNMPDDCTFSFESTIPDVTFTEADILAGGWEQQYGDRFDPIISSEPFQANTSYRFVISLDNKGLTEAPAVTVNGKTADCQFATLDGVPCAINIVCDLGTPPTPAEPTITIDGADTVCAQQDYEFTVTASEGATPSQNCAYLSDAVDTVSLLSIDDNGVGHGVISKDWYENANSFTLTASVQGGSAKATKTVQISREHIYVDGVCGCGARQQYTVQYDCAPFEVSIPDGVKTHGVDYTLSSQTITREGYVHTGWMDKYGNEYELGGAYYTDEDMTFYPVFEQIITVTVPFTTTVALGDAGEPGEKTFTLAVLGANTGEENYADVTVSGSVTTNGAGSYNGTMTFTGPERQLWLMLSEGAFVQQVDDGAEGWTVDDTVYGLILTQIAAYSLDDSAQSYAVLVVPTTTDDDGNYQIDWETIDWEQELPGEMTFTNTYSAHVYELKHDADGHWDECGCGDRQNEEPHEYGDWEVTKEATEQEAGEKERVCVVCGYAEQEEIARLPATDTSNPTKDNPAGGAATILRTGDNSHMALWMALLFVSGAGIIGTTVYAKKKRAK